MIKKLQAIAIGHYNNIMKSNPDVEEKAKLRKEICLACSAKRYSIHDRHYICSSNGTTKHSDTGLKTNGCGCPIEAKVRQDVELCPAGHWK